jgi:hypothetical protein
MDPSLLLKNAVSTVRTIKTCEDTVEAVIEIVLTDRLRKE